ncbi:MAG: hypothetical protein AAF598_08470 [Bacteroidota bacterium]
MKSFLCVSIVFLLSVQIGLAQFNQVGVDILGSGFQGLGRSAATNQSGEIMAFGGPSVISTTAPGEVRVFRKTGSTYQPYGAPLFGTNNGDEFGSAVALNAAGSLLVVGSPKAGPNNAGLVQIFQFNGGNWIQLGNSILGDDANELFGAAVDMSDSGDRIIVGAPDGNGGTVESGYAQVFEFQNNQWNPLGTILPGDLTFAEFGTSVSMNASGTVVGAGAPGNFGGQGQVKVFRWQNNSWSNLGNTITGSSYGNARFGQSIDISDDGNIIAVGAFFELHASGMGVVRIFERDFFNTWDQVGNNIVGSSNMEGFGFDVAINNDGSRIAIGTPSAKDINENGGRVNIFDFQGGSWTEYGSPILGPSGFDHLGWSVDLSQFGNALVIGASGESGYVRFYEDDQLPVAIDNPALFDVIAISRKGMMELQFPAELLQENIELQIVDVSGKVLYRAMIQQQANWSISHRWQGVVFIEIKAGQDKMSKGIWVSSE